VTARASGGSAARPGDPNGRQREPGAERPADSGSGRPADPGSGRPADSGSGRPADPAAEPPADSGAGSAPAPAASGAASATDSAAVNYQDRWLRAEAELQNYRRRAARDLDEARRAAEERVMLEMIAAIDDLERALEAARAAGAQGSWTAGVELTLKRMREALARDGVQTLDPLGEPFDPVRHEAMLSVVAPPGVDPGSVTAVTLKGYVRDGRTLRAARVVVARASAPSSETRTSGG